MSKLRDLFSRGVYNSRLSYGNTVATDYSNYILAQGVAKSEKQYFIRFDGWSVQYMVGRFTQCRDIQIYYRLALLCQVN